MSLASTRNERFSNIVCLVNREVSSTLPVGKILPTLVDTVIGNTINKTVTAQSIKGYSHRAFRAKDCVGSYLPLFSGFASQQGINRTGSHRACFSGGDDNMMKNNS